MEPASLRGINYARARNTEDTPLSGCVAQSLVPVSGWTNLISAMKCVIGVYGLNEQKIVSDNDESRQAF